MGNVFQVVIKQQNSVQAHFYDPDEIMKLESDRALHHPSFDSSCRCRGPRDHHSLGLLMGEVHLPAIPAFRYQA